MFNSKLKHNALKKAFLKTMDNKRGNDFAANQDIARLASTMTDAQINQAYAAAHDHAKAKNSKKNGIGDTKDPYKNIDSASARAAQYGAFRANDWMNAWPAVPPGLWNFLNQFGF